jgi:DNA-binding MarR family transcriptional regulator
VSAPKDLIDSLAAALDDDVQLIIDGNEADRASALAIALAGRDVEQRFSDVASDRSAERLRQLSDEVGRIATTLARLSTGPVAAMRPAEPEPSGTLPEVSAETVRAIIRARRLRARHFPEELFADPAWDMLLDLLQAEISHLRVPVSSLCIAAAVPATTALRWLKTMVKEGIFLRRADPHDGRRVFVELAPETSRSLRRYFAEVGPIAVV